MLPAHLPPLLSLVPEEVPLWGWCCLINVSAYRSQEGSELMQHHVLLLFLGSSMLASEALVQHRP